MKNLSAFIAFVITMAVLYSVYVNVSNISGVICPVTVEKYNMSIGYFQFITFFIGIVTGTLFLKSYFDGKIETLNAYKRKCEKLSVQSDTDETKVQALEAKIKTLEIALENALKNK